MIKRRPERSGNVGPGSPPRNWKNPPATIRRRACRLGTQSMLGATSSEGIELIGTPQDVRACAMHGDQTFALTREDPEATLTLAAERGTDGLWRFEGRIWATDRDIDRIRIAVGHDDHVVVVRAVGNGDFFEIAEALTEPWWIEVHLPSGRVLRLEDPVR